MYGQATAPATPAPVKNEPRPMAPLELEIWERFKKFHQGKVTAAVFGYLKTAELAARMQAYYDAQGLAVDLWTSYDQADIDDVLNRFNTISRLIIGLETRKYFIHLERGDITAVAPAAMNREEYNEDLYPGFGFPILIPIIVGVVLLAGFFAADEMIQTSAYNKQLELHKAIVQADAEVIISGSKAAQAQYGKWKQLNLEAIQAADRANPRNKPGFFETLSGGIAKIGQVGIVIGALVLAFFVLSKDEDEKPKRLATTPNPCAIAKGRSGAMYIPPQGGRDPVGRDIRWSSDAKKRTRQAQHILDYYLLTPQERAYMKEAERIHKRTGATSITFEPWKEW